MGLVARGRVFENHATLKWMDATMSQILRLVLFLLAGRAGAHTLPVVVVNADDTVLTESCVVRVAPGTVIEDANGNGVIQIGAPGIVVEFEPGSVLRGAAIGAAPDTMKGLGLVIEGHAGVTVRGAAIEGFKVGFRATGADGLVVDGATLRDNFRQRLRSVPAAEDSGDWLWPHANDKREWATNYGASLLIERSNGVEVRRVVVRDGQNGIMLDRVEDSKFYDNDCSFLSGWGISMWRSSRNVITRNALDFCVRGYSHGIYNRGQDSAGLLMFEQCSENLIAENSITHGGDGIFGFGGKEALGDVPGPEGFDHTRKGCNDNLFIGNDLSYAPAHGLEMTFSFGNRVIGNRIVGNAICGIWGGYSQETVVASNVFAENGSNGYGLERGGINIEHGRRNVFVDNRFEGNAAGIHLWTDDDGALMKSPWALKNYGGSVENTIARNTFTGDTTGVHVRATGSTWATGNVFTDVGTEVRVEGGAEALSEPPQAVGAYEVPEYVALGESRPVGARAHLAGREKMIVGEWGPWDHERAFMRPVNRSGRVHRYEVWGDGDVSVESTSPRVDFRVDREGEGPTTVRVEAGPGVHRYEGVVRATGLQERISGTLVAAEWTVRMFPWTADPREDLEGWRAESTGPAARTVTLDRVNLAYRHGGPSDLKLSEEVTAAVMPKDRFGTIATTVIPLTAGTWRFTTLSDDGVRVVVNGKPVIENWTWHAPTRDTGTITLEGDANVEIVVEHFELDGYAVLELSIEPEG